MARTAYCKRCGQEVDAGEMCPLCGTRLGKNSAHVAWCAERIPVLDWMCWNSVMRLLLPGTLAIAALVLLAEGIAGGFGAVEKMLTSAFPAVLGILLVTVLVVLFMILLMQGKELSDFVVDNRGIHETRYLPNATPLKLILRLKAPQMPKEGEKRLVQLSERHIAWKDIARVQLWPEKCMVLFYAPSWWLRIPVICTPFTWDDTMEYIREKLGKKKKVRLPGVLTVQAQPAGRRTQPAPAYTEPDTMQMTLDDLPLPEEAPAEPESAENGTDPLT